MYEKLCAAVGDERFELIGKLNHNEIDYICSHVKSCRLCPLALHYGDGEYICLDYASMLKVRDVLRRGGKFIELKGI